MIRVAFPLFGGAGWTGGLHYLRSVLSALHQYASGQVQAVLFASPDARPGDIDSLRPYLHEAPVIVPGWSSDRKARLSRAFQTYVLQSDLVSLSAFRRADIDLVFQQDAWYGWAFQMKTLVWLADFQHERLPGMFTPIKRLRRSAVYAGLARTATSILLSSESAANDARRFLPSNSADKFCVSPFAVMTPAAITSSAIDATRTQLALPEKYVFLPNQLWKHKNHLRVVEAVKLLKQRQVDIRIIATGNPNDPRHPEHPDHILREIELNGLGTHLKFLGLVEYRHILPMLAQSHALLNPSLFEGWSTTVEEAKALGRPLVLSNIDVHVEQAREVDAIFFDPNSTEELAGALTKVWMRPQDPNQQETVSLALSRYEERRQAFADRLTNAFRTATAHR